MLYIEHFLLYYMYANAFSQMSVYGAVRPTVLELPTI